MSSFRSPEQQAHWARIEMGGHRQPRAETRQEPGKQSSIGTSRAYEQSLKQLAQHLKDTRQGDLKSVNRDQVENWLRHRAEEVGQKQLDQDRQATQAWLSYRYNQEIRIPRSEHKTRLDESKNLANQSRVYEPQQLDRIQSRLSDHNSLAVQICRETGARAHEVGTIARPSEQPPNDRNWREDKFSGKDGISYTVQGKGGLTREVKLSRETADRLEQQRKDQPTSERDRGINYQSRYNVASGQSLSQAFTRASKAELGWSAGLHGLRHVYAQDRLDKMQEQGYTYTEAKEVVSQEVGHFREQTTEEYLR